MLLKGVRVNPVRMSGGSMLLDIQRSGESML